MQIDKAVITAAASHQRSLPLQQLIDRDGREKSLLRILVEEAYNAGIGHICLVVCPGDEAAYAAAVGACPAQLHFVRQEAPRGYGHAVFCAREFVAGEAFLHMVGDHLYIRRGQQGCASQLLQAARAESCAVAAVQPTRESQLPYFGAVGGQRLNERQNLYRIEAVLEKPTPTEAERKLAVSGLRAGHYLCFFGMHVLSATIFDLLEAQLQQSDGSISLSTALDHLAHREQYLALRLDGWRYDLGARYGLLTAQMALALEGSDRDEVLAKMLDLIARRQMASEADSS